MRYSDIDQSGLKTNDSKPGLTAVPDCVADAFLRGLDDVRNGRVVDGDAVIAESRTLLSEHREKKRKDDSSLTNGS